MRSLPLAALGLGATLLLAGCASTSNGPVNFRKSSSSSLSSASSSAKSASSAGKPFFAQSGSSASSLATEEAGNIKVHIDSDRQEVHPGDDVTVTVTVKNLTAKTLDHFQVLFSFPADKLTVVETDGEAQGTGVQWTVDDLEAGQKRALRLRAIVSASLLHGDTIAGTVVTTYDGQVEPQSASLQLEVIEHLPATGAGNGTDPVEDTGRFLRPVGE
jgi:hypothetical protein